MINLEPSQAQQGERSEPVPSYSFLRTAARSERERTKLWFFLREQRKAANETHITKQ